MRITNTIEINSTPEEVFDWLKDPNKAMEWIEHHPGTAF
jgi:carbon monoxide dehydrogenase subunit G